MDDVAEEIECTLLRFLDKNVDVANECRKMKLMKVYKRPQYFMWNGTWPSRWFNYENHVSHLLKIAQIKIVI